MALEEVIHEMFFYRFITDTQLSPFQIHAIVQGMWILLHSDLLPNTLLNPSRNWKYILKIINCQRSGCTSVILNGREKHPYLSVVGSEYGVNNRAGNVGLWVRGCIGGFWTKSIPIVEACCISTTQPPTVSLARVPGSKSGLFPHTTKSTPCTCLLMI